MYVISPPHVPPDQLFVHRISVILVDVRCGSDVVLEVDVEDDVEDDVEVDVLVEVRA